MDAAGLNQVHIHAQQTMEVREQASEIEQSSATVEVHQDIDIAIGRVLAGGNRAEYADVAAAVHLGQAWKIPADRSMIAPRGGFFLREGKWAAENEGAAPDVDVENWPKDAVAGPDAQIERVVQEGLRMLKEKPVKRLGREPAPPV